MPRYKAPNTDAARLSFLDKAVETATTTQLAGTSQIDAPLLAELTAHLALFRAANRTVQNALSDRTGETAEVTAAMSKLTMHISHMWTAVYHRYLREEQSVRILGYYRLGSDGNRPSITKRRDALLMADELIGGDAKAITEGFAPIAQPTVAELTAVRDRARTEVKDAPLADAAYDRAQAAVAALRPEADRLIKEARDMILYAARNMDAASQRRVLRNHGAQYYYLPSEKIDEGDETAVVEEVVVV